MPTQLDNLISHYQKQLKPQVETFASNVAQVIRTDPLVAEDVRPLVVWRAKSEKSLLRKLASQGPHEPLSPETLGIYIADLGGVRVIVHDRRSIAKVIDVVEKQISDTVWVRHSAKVYAWDPQDQAIREIEPDWDLSVQWSPRGSYRSRHIVVGQSPRSPVRCEIQFRTVLEEAIFEARHRLVYRVEQEGRTPEPHVRKVLGTLTEMLTAADDLVSDCFEWSALSAP